MTPFHISLHASPGAALPTEIIQLDGRPLTRLVVAPQQLHQPLAITFEEAVQQLSELPRMFCELDGSFVWVSQHSASHAWQLDGLLLDRGGRLQTVEIKGNCPVAAWDQLVAAVSGGSPGLVVQLMQTARFVSEPEFRRYQFDA